MKMTRLIYPLIFATALTLLGTGCKHKPVGMTNLPGPAPTGAGDQTPLNQPPITPDNPITTTPVTTPTGGGNLPGPFDPSKYNQDRDALKGDTIHFKFDSAAVLGTEESKVSEVASALKSDATVMLQIEGYCDERGTEEYNRALGDRRALAAREELVKQGVDSQRITTISFGKDNPVDKGHDEAAWKANRRDEFVLLRPKS